MSVQLAQRPGRTPTKRWAGAARYEKRRAFLKAAGTWQPWADMAPVRAHLESLLAAGLTKTDIAGRSGVATTTLDYLMGEDRSRCRVRVAQRLLAVQPTPVEPLGGHKTNSVGTQRRLQALMVAGWSAQVIADRLGMNRETIRKILANDLVRVSTARAVRALFADMWDKFPPSEARYDRASATRTSAYAARQGWVSGLAWDDIDDPKAKPKGVRAAEAEPTPVVVEPARDRTVKTCPRCDHTKPIEGFAFNRTRPDGRSSYCKTCQAAYREARKARPRRVEVAA